MALPSAVPRLSARATPPAPLDAHQVAAAAAEFGTSRMLPRDAYFSPDVLAWERSHLFGGWVGLGRAEAVAEPGTVRAETLGDYGVVLTRDRDGTLRAFENACRHRGHELLPCGTSATPRALVCPYHAWAYRYDGSLIAAPGFANAAGFDASGMSLKPLQVREWHGWVFVAGDADAPDFADHIGDLEQVVGPYGAEGMVTPVTHDYEVAANWKVIVENYQECYHCTSIHPELCAVSAPDSGDNIELAGNWIGGSMTLLPHAQTMSLDGHSEGVAIAGLNQPANRSVMYVALLPNLLISLHPDYVMTHQLVPLSPGMTRIRCTWSFPRDVAEAPSFDPAYAVDFWDITNRQDWEACESVQRGLASPSYEPGPLAPAEDGVYHFTSLIARAYQGHPAGR